MPKGGHARSGPPPDPNALRRSRDVGEWVTLPAEGRPGDPPDWPLPTCSEREQELWRIMWRKPQAIMWERNGQHLDVALYCRRFAEAEEPDSPVNLSTLVRQMQDSLGLSTPGLRSNRWRIAADEMSARRADRAEVEASRPGRQSARDRLKAISGGGA